jgi:hypothetical protein
MGAPSFVAAAIRRKLLGKSETGSETPRRCQFQGVREFHCIDF